MLHNKCLTFTINRFAAIGYIAQRIAKMHTAAFAKSI